MHAGERHCVVETVVTENRRQVGSVIAEWTTSYICLAEIETAISPQHAAREISRIAAINSATLNPVLQLHRGRAGLEVEAFNAGVVMNSSRQFIAKRPVTRAT
ncbi:hypothetical protein D3C85_1166520 [compost metagenome]